MGQGSLISALASSLLWQYNEVKAVVFYAMSGPRFHEALHVSSHALPLPHEVMPELIHWSQKEDEKHMGRAVPVHVPYLK